MCTRMCSQNSRGVYVVCIGFGTAGMIEGKAEGVEILVCGDDGEEGVVVGVGWGREAGFDD